MYGTLQSQRQNPDLRDHAQIYLQTNITDSVIKKVNCRQNRTTCYTLTTNK